MPLATPAQVFARIERAHAAWTRGGATVSVSNITPTGANRAQFRLDLDGAGAASLRVKTPPRSGLAATDQAFVLRGSTLVGVDFVAREAIVRPSPANVPLGIRLVALLGGIDDSIGFLTMPQIRTQYLSPLKKLSGWQVIPSGLQRRTTAAGKVSLTKLDVDAAGRLKGLHVVLPGSRLDWSIAYGPAKVISVPRGLKRVEAFTARLQPPKYANPEAKRAVERLTKAGSSLKSAIVRIDGSATLWFDGPRVRYESGASGFAYDGKTLTVRTPVAAYRGRTSRALVIDHTAALLGTMDPLVRSVLVRSPLFSELFTARAKVRVVGTMMASGQPCDVVAVDSPAYRASLFVRKKDGLPASIETESLGARGNVFTRSTRTLQWSSVGVPLDRSLFALRLRQGQSLLPLPKRTVTAP
ncbi:hypothetical protein EON82_19615 [bacterium]|nr:MAG: hypothetical protein EON82_19615 [bacterium]